MAKIFSGIVLFTTVHAPTSEKVKNHARYMMTIQKVRNDLIGLFKSKTIGELVRTTKDSEQIFI